MTTFLIVALILAGAGGVIWWVYGRGKSRQEILGSAKNAASKPVASWFDRIFPSEDWAPPQVIAPAPAQAAPSAPPSAVPPPPAPLPVPLVPDVPVREGVDVPADHRAVHARIATFEPEDDAAWITFIQSEAAAKMAEAEAWRAHADVLVDGIGLDPNAAAAVPELAELIAEMSADFAMTVRRYATVYQEVIQFRAEGGVLPYNARTWLTGEI